MTCREFAAFILDYLQGDLSAELRVRFEEHLACCENCERYLDQYRTTVDVGRALFEEPDADLPAEVPPELIRAILAVRR